VLALVAGLIAIVLLVTGVTVARAGDAAVRREAKLRYPVALALADDGRLLLAANQRSGSVSLIDLTRGSVAAEVPIGQSLTDLVAVPNAGDAFLAADFKTHQLLLLTRSGIDINVVKRLSVSPCPVSVKTNEEGTRCYVASQWSRKLTVVELLRGGAKVVDLAEIAAIPLPFAPRCQIVSPGSASLIVADAFGGKLAVIDPVKCEIAAVHTIPASNIRGMAWSDDGKRLLVAHQTLNRHARTSQEDIHWGSLVGNVIRSVDRELLSTSQTELHAGSRLISLGDVGDGGADPASIVTTEDGTIFVALAGTGDVAVGKDDGEPFRRVYVGGRPNALLSDARAKQVYVARTFGDCLTIVTPNGIATATISLGPQPELTPAERGEHLFFDARLSHDKWMSCHSCHSEGHTVDVVSDTLGDGSYGAPKRIPTLLGTAETGPWGWTGRFQTLAEQVRHSAMTTMHGNETSESQVDDLTAYLKSLPLPPAIDATPNDAQRVAIEQGRVVFSRQKCDRCHAPPSYTSADVYDVGLKDEAGNSRFNPPSLRGVAERAAWFHDGRARSLEKVFSEYRHQVSHETPDRELADLVEFLRSL
jgi:cytochrome c peroxidase